MPTIPETTLAYIAGIIDGDGYISITRSIRKGVEYFGAQVGISGTRREPHDLASTLFGGRVSAYKPKNLRHRTQFQWSRVGSGAVEVIRAIEPYLLIKKEHALLAMALHDHVTEARGEDAFPWFGPDHDPMREARNMREEMISLNQSRNRIGKLKAGRLLDGVDHSEFPEEFL